MKNSIVLGSFSKTVTPGMRLGYIISAIKKYFPSQITSTIPQGGMFLWVTLPQNVSALSLFPKALEKKVAFVLGNLLTHYSAI